MDSKKQCSWEDLPDRVQSLRDEGKRIVHCHGTFDLLHPGHMVHFREAREQGDVLVVTFTAEDFVRKGPGRPYFNDQVRAMSLASLEVVDLVAPVPHVAAVEAIEAVRPDFYCKGIEYRDPSNDPTGNIGDDLVAVEKAGGEVKYVGSVVFSSTRLLNRHFDTQRPEVKEFCRDLSERWDPGEVKRVVDEFSGLKVLIIGDTIFDRYSEVAVQGLTSKNKTVSVRHLDDETQAGGSLAVYRHIRQFTPQVKLISLSGTESWLETELEKYIEGEHDRIVRSPEYTTIVKHRFNEPTGEGREVHKLFSVNYLEPNPPPDAAIAELTRQIEEEIENVDLVLVMDFGHGVMQEPIRRMVEERAGFLALNCQTNSSNFGFNVINRRYRRADLFTIDTAEMSLARAERDYDPEKGLEEMAEFFDSRYGFFTRGNSPTFGIREHAVVECPALETVVKDTVGAGDAFCSVASLAGARSLPTDLATFLGQVAGAQAVRIVGNRDCIDKGEFLKAATNLLSH